MAAENLSAVGEFQSTLPRRERPSEACCKRRQRKFQSTLPRRERHQDGCINVSWNRISIHTPTKGATKSAKRL